MSDGDYDFESDFTVLTGTKGPAVLIECGFMTNPDDLARLRNPVSMERLCATIAEGIVDWFIDLTLA
jgi:N-acetylmuramoyl-L-alanine amidase